MTKQQTHIEFRIVTPEGIVYQDAIEQVTIPTATGQITVLPNHIGLVSLLRAGELLLKKDGQTIALAVSTGIIEVRPNSKVYILADTAERAERIDVERAELARHRAQELLKQQEHIEDVDFARIQASLEKELARLHVAKKYR